MVGTFLYASRSRHAKSIVQWTVVRDLYSLGVVLLNASRVPPFQAKDVGELVHEHATKKPPALGDLKPGTSAVLVALIEKLLAKDPDDRYLNARELISELGTRGAKRAGFLGFTGWQKRARRASRLLPFGVQPRGSVILIEGEPGSGKTRLIQACAQTAHQRPLSFSGQSAN